MTIVDFDICHQMAQLQNLNSVTMTQILKVKIFKWLLTSKRWKNANINIELIWEVSYLTSNGATANVVHHDLDLYFQEYKF